MGKTRRAGGDDRALLNLWLTHLSRASHAHLQLDDDGICTIGHESGLDCAVELPGNGSVYLRVAMFPWEPETNPDLAERCLLASFMGIETGGAAFGVDPIDVELVLWQERSVGSLDEAGFSRLVTQLFDNAVRLRKELGDAEAAAKRDTAHERRPPLDFSMRRV